MQAKHDVFGVEAIADDDAGKEGAVLVEAPWGIAGRARKELVLAGFETIEKKFAAGIGSGRGFITFDFES